MQPFHRHHHHVKQWTSNAEYRYFVGSSKHHGQAAPCDSLDVIHSPRGGTKAAFTGVRSPFQHLGTPISPKLEYMGHILRGTKYDLLQQFVQGKIQSKRVVERTCDSGLITAHRHFSGLLCPKFSLPE
ncbi:jg12599 [Pararge aegeria aegeria]|uniref:Jg12599 protein n=1 Tax=Pararge aegeria aegeria TaxID=348720 RepID=A0A8S4SEM0_9NEOP|nr:jg12599 [Pararge aegeria aegeria]